MTEPQQLPALLGATAESIVDNAKDLGLTWTLRPATVVSDPSGPSVIYDGDSAVVGVETLIGTAIPTDRVMMLQIPPGGNYIIGRLTGTPFTPKTTLTFRGEVLATGDVTLTTSSQVIIPLFSITVTSPAQYMIVPNVDFDAFVAGGNNLIAATLRVDGVGDTKQMIFQENTSGVRLVLSKTYFGNLTTGTHTFDMIAAKSNATGGWATRAVGTSLVYEIYQ